MTASLLYGAIIVIKSFAPTVIVGKLFLWESDHNHLA